MAAIMIVPASRTLVLAVTLPLKTTPQGPLTQDPNRARGQRLDMLRAEPGITSDCHTLIQILSDNQNNFLRATALYLAAIITLCDLFCHYFEHEHFILS